MNSTQNQVKFCWWCSKILYQRKAKVILNIDNHNRTLHIKCGKEITESGDFVKKVTYHSVFWSVS